VSILHRRWLLYSAMVLVLSAVLLATGTAATLAPAPHHRTVATHLLKGQSGSLRPAHAGQHATALAYAGHLAASSLVDCGRSRIPARGGRALCSCQSPRAPPCPAVRVS
jgi:hypothetical protein